MPLPERAASAVPSTCRWRGQFRSSSGVRSGCTFGTSRVGSVPFEPNEPQRRLLARIEERRREGRPVRVLILKARQLGFSTLSLGLQYEYTTGAPGSQALMAAHDDESAVDLFDRLRLMHDLAPAQPMTRYSNRRELDFSNPDRTKARTNPGLLSKIVVGTAGKINLGRSKTLRFLHLSKVAFWKDAGRVLLSLEQALPDDSDTVEIIESTANGVGGEFYQRWKRAENPETCGDWIAMFFPWHEDPEYRKPLVDAGAAAWAATLVANQTRRSVEVQVTGEAAKVIRWSAKLDTVEV